MDCSLLSSSVHGFPKQKYWSGLPFPSLEDIPNSGIKLASPALQAYSLPLSHQGSLLAISNFPVLSLTFANTVQGLLLQP